MRVASVCSGIGGAELAFHGLAEHAFAAEIDPFARAVLAHRFPDLTVHHDFTEIQADGAVDVLVGGTPCQSFSIAGLRGGMADARGNLALEFLRLADRLRARWVLWENVPGVLSSSEGRDFGAFLGGLAELGYGWAYRVLDAQFFGLAQRRKRVFVVGCLGDWRRAAAVLFEPACLRGNPPPRRETREGVAAPLTRGADSGGKGGYAGRRREDDCNLIAFDSKDLTLGGDGHTSTLGTNGEAGHAGGRLAIAGTLNAAFGRKSGLDNQHIDNGCPLFVTHALRADGFDASEDGTGRGTPLVPINLQVATRHNALGRDTGFGLGCDGEAAFTIGANHSHGIGHGSSVRRLTPREAERLQGFPDNWTAITYRGKPAADGPRYRALGNAFAVPVVRWIARRLAAEHRAILAAPAPQEARAAGLFAEAGK